MVGRVGGKGHTSAGKLAASIVAGASKRAMQKLKSLMAHSIHCSFIRQTQHPLSFNLLR